VPDDEAATAAEEKPLPVPPPSMASSLFGSSVPMTIPRQMAAGAVLSSSLLAEAARAVVAQYQSDAGTAAGSIRIAGSLLPAAAPMPPLPSQDNLFPPTDAELAAADRRLGVTEVRLGRAHAVALIADTLIWLGGWGAVYGAARVCRAHVCG
jgi:hypothetical protein